jgi:hypothetical protein
MKIPLTFPSPLRVTHSGKGFPLLAAVGTDDNICDYKLPEWVLSSGRKSVLIVTEGKRRGKGAFLHCLQGVQGKQEVT